MAIEKNCTILTGALLEESSYVLKMWNILSVNYILKTMFYDLKLHISLYMISGCIILELGILKEKVEMGTAGHNP